jgi:hypothetical protein
MTDTSAHPEPSDENLQKMVSVCNPLTNHRQVHSEPIDRRMGTEE